MVSNHKELLRATSIAHEALHSLPMFEGLLAGSMRRKNYIAMLERLYGFYASFDAAVQNGLRSNRLEIAFESRAPMLAEDLSIVDFEDTYSIPNCEMDLSLDLPARVAGALYVVEGASLGGAVMRKALLANPAIGGVSPTGYWCWCALVGTPAWRTKRPELLAEARDGESLAQMIASANAVFDIFRRWFDPAGEPAR